MTPLAKLQKSIDIAKLQTMQIMEDPHLVAKALSEAAATARREALEAAEKKVASFIMLSASYDWNKALDSAATAIRALQKSK